MESALLLTTCDGRFDLVVEQQLNFFRFTIKPHATESTLANTRHFAFEIEAMRTLVMLGYEADYAADFVRCAFDHLKKRNDALIAGAVAQVLS
jgi:Holliday junction resolvasome RuvABC DNA-binding subunit